MTRLAAAAALAASLCGCTYYTAAVNGGGDKLYVFGGYSLAGLGWLPFVRRCTANPSSGRMVCRDLDVIDEGGRSSNYAPTPSSLTDPISREPR